MITFKQHPQDPQLTVIATTCCICNNSEKFTLTTELVDRWRDGECIQNVFPGMSGDDRERLMTGTCPACWDKMFLEEDAQKEADDCFREY